MFDRDLVVGAHNRPLQEAQPLQANEYAELKRLVKQKGLLDKQLAYYTYKMLLTLSLLALSIIFLAIVDNLWLQLLNAAFLAFVLVQIFFIGHDLGHQQVFRSTRANEIFGLVISFIVGASRTWWVEKHNQHHSNPNDLDLDPDIEIPVLAFSEDQALNKTGVYRFVVRYQAFFFYPILCLEGFGVRLASVLYMLRNKGNYPMTEPLLMAAHIAIYLGSMFYLLSAWHAMIFIVVNQLVIGLYLGWTFAPNHKGMLLLDSKGKMDFLRRQVLTSRNVKSSSINDFLYGGLNYQIEHHLFPSMPRNRLKEAQKIVKPFCRAHSIPYHETSVLQSQREILQYLHHVSAPLRVKSAGTRFDIR